MSVTLIPSELVAAYEDSVFSVEASPTFALYIGKNSEAADALLKSHKVQTAAIITACNPYSQLLSDDENLKRNNELERELRKLSSLIIHAKGQDKAGEWPSEPSYFVLGVDQVDIAAIAIKYQQNAIVWYEQGQAARLILLR